MEWTLIDFKNIPPDFKDVLVLNVDNIVRIGRLEQIILSENGINWLFVDEESNKVYPSHYIIIPKLKL